MRLGRTGGGTSRGTSRGTSGRSRSGGRRTPRPRTGGTGFPTGGTSTGGGLPKGGCGGAMGLIGIVIVLIIMFAGGGLPGGGGGGGGTTAERTDLVGTNAVTADDLSASDRAALRQYTADLAVDVSTYWETQYPATYGGRYSEPEYFAFNPTNPDRNLSCGQRLSPNILANNAIYCPAGDYVTWDEHFLFPKLQANFGRAAVGVVLAHEWGHAIQGPVRAQVQGRTTIFKELQADCFAGAWVKNVQDDKSPLLSPFNDAELDGAVAGFLLLRDPPGTDPTQQGAHGSAFDRIGSFEDGLISGADYCASYNESSTDKPRITPLSFTADDEDSGNLSYDIAVDVVINALNEYYSEVLVDQLGEEQLGLDEFRSSLDGVPSCPGTSSRSHGIIFYCPATTSISWDADSLVKIHDEIGDFAVSQLFAHEYGHAIIDLVGYTGTGEALEIAADCLAGAWSAAVNSGQLFVPDPLNTSSSVPLQMSPGDLDEGLATMLRFRHPAAGSDRSNEADLFERSRAFQVGFFNDANTCLQ